MALNDKFYSWKEISSVVPLELTVPLNITDLEEATKYRTSMFADDVKTGIIVRIKKL